MTSLAILLISFFANAQSVEQTLSYGTTSETERQGTNYDLKLGSACSFRLEASWEKSKPGINLHFRDDCPKKSTAQLTIDSFDKLLSSFQSSHDPSLVKGVMTGQLGPWRQRIIEIYLKEPVDPKNAPSYDRYADLFNEHDVDREFVDVLKKHGISVRLDSIEKMFRADPKDPLIAEFATPELLKRKASIPVGAGVYWFAIPSEARSFKKIVATEWSGACRKFVNEEKSPLKGKEKQRLQSRYRFEAKKITWSVLAFNDTKCKKMISGDQYTFECAGNPFEATTTCTQKSHSAYVDSKWTAQASDGMKIDYSAKKFEKTVQLTSTGESGDAETEELYASP